MNIKTYLALGTMYVLTVVTGRDYPARLKVWAEERGHTYDYAIRSLVLTSPIAALLWPLGMCIRIGKRIKETA